MNKSVQLKILFTENFLNIPGILVALSLFITITSFAQKVAEVDPETAYFPGHNKKMNVVTFCENQTRSLKINITCSSG